MSGWPPGADPSDMLIRLTGDDRGTSLIEYGLLGALIALGSLGLIANVGDSTSASFDTAAGAFDQSGGVAEEEMTPQEKWDQAKEDYNRAIADAKAEKAGDVAAAKTEYQAALEANKSLPKTEKKAANTAANDVYKTAKARANDTYQASVQEAKGAKAKAKAEYKASK